MPTYSAVQWDETWCVLVHVSNEYDDEAKQSNGHRAHSKGTVHLGGEAGKWRVSGGKLVDFVHSG